MTPVPEITVVGGGITGLASAYYAKKFAAEAGINVQVSLYEASDRFGGKLITYYRDGFVFEGGPDSFLTAKPWAVQLAQELNVELIGTNDDRRNIYVLRAGVLHPVPDGLRLIVPVDGKALMRSEALSVEGRYRALSERFIPPRMEESDESMGAFIRRRFGAEMLEVFGEPMMAGIYVADADELSMQASFPRFIQMEREHGSLIEAMRKTKANRLAAAATHPAGDKTSMFMSPKGGLQAFIDAIVADLAASDNVTLYRNQPLDTVPNAGAVILTVSARDAANLLAASDAQAPQELIGLLSEIEYSTTATISVAYHTKDVDYSLNGFGFVVPKREATSLIACTWTSTKFDYRAADDHVVLRAFVGKAHAYKSDQELVALVNTEVETIMGISTMPVDAQVHRWIQGSPIFKVGHLARVSRMEALMPSGVFLAGASYRGVGLPDCVHQAQQAAEKALVSVTNSDAIRA